MPIGTNGAVEPVQVNANQGALDMLQAMGRYAVVIVGAATALLALFKARDVAGMSAYLQTNGGQLVGAIAGLVTTATAAYGIFKSHKRGAQVATVAADPRVPDDVATLKE